MYLCAVMTNFSVACNMLMAGFCKGLRFVSSSFGGVFGRMLVCPAVELIHEAKTLPISSSGIFEV